MPFQNILKTLKHVKQKHGFYTILEKSD